MNAVKVREQTIEDCLHALADVIGDTTIPREVRDKATWLQRDLHACRSAETVARMETEMGIAPGGQAA